MSNYALDIFSCPPNPYATRSIRFTRCDNLSVTNGAVNEIDIPLGSFFIPVDNAYRATFILPAREGEFIPLENVSLSFDNLATDGKVKYFNLFMSYPKGTTESLQYIEWTSVESIEDGTLDFLTAVGPSSSAGISFDIDNTTRIRNGNYAISGISEDADVLLVSTSGGFLFWDGSQFTFSSKLKNSLSSDFVTCAIQDNEGYIWIGNDSGISKVSPTGVLITEFTSENSELVSDDIRDLYFLTNDRLAIATSGGVSIYDKSEQTWLTYTKYNTNGLRSNDVRRIAVIDSDMFVTTDIGVFIFDFSDNTWSSTYFSSSTAGWSVGSSSSAIASYGSNLYVGASGGLVVVPTGGGTCTIFTAGSTGPLSNSYNDLQVESGSTSISDKLVAAHPTGFSVYSLTSSSWSLTGASGNFSYFSDGCNTVEVKRRSNDRIYFGNSRGVGFYDYAGLTYGEIPGATHNGQLIFSYPENSNQLYSISQDIYLLYTKPVGHTSLENNFSFISGSGETGPTLSGTFTYSDHDKVVKFSTTGMERASLYQYKVMQGVTSTDATYFSNNEELSFYTEEYTPELGWQVAGKQLTHSGTKGRLVPNIYLRNPHDFDVTVTILVGN